MINEQNVTYLNRCLKLARIPHSLLLAGPHTSPKEACAVQFAHQLLGLEETFQGNHPDLYIYKPEGKLGLHLMETMRQLTEEVYLPPYQSLRKVFILFDAERMQTASANALLKTFEEPLKTSVLILVSSFPEKILPTIKSRCQILYFQEAVATASQGLSQNQMPINGALLEILRSLPSLDHLNLLDKVAALSKSLEDEVAAPELEKIEGETALQKQAREKEGEGQEAMGQLRTTESLWIAILSWYRDLHALQAEAASDHLFYPQELNALKRCMQEGNVPSLEGVSSLVDQAKRALERSGPLKHVLESFFLGLK